MIKSVINNYINNSVHVCIPSQNNVDVFAKYIAFKPMCLEIAVLLYSLVVYIYVFYIAITDTSFATNTYSNSPCSLIEQLIVIHFLQFHSQETIIKCW